MLKEKTQEGKNSNLRRDTARGMTSATSTLAQMSGTIAHTTRKRRS